MATTLMLSRSCLHVNAVVGSDTASVERYGEKGCSDLLSVMECSSFKSLHGRLDRSVGGEGRSCT